MGERLKEFALLDRLVCDVIDRTISSLNFSTDSKQQLALASFYFSIVEQSRAVLCLFDKDLGHHSGPILRSQLEAYADLLNTVKDEAYLKNLELANLRARRKLLVLILSGNPYSEGMEKTRDIAEIEISEIGKKINCLVAEGAKDLQLKEKMANVDMTDEAAACLPWLNAQTHGDLAAVTDRHLVTVGRRLEIHCLTNGKSAEYSPNISLSCDLILQASVSIHTYFATGKEIEFQQIIQSRKV